MVNSWSSSFPEVKYLRLLSDLCGQTHIQYASRGPEGASNMAASGQRPNLVLRNTSNSVLLKQLFTVLIFSPTNMKKCTVHWHGHNSIISVCARWVVIKCCSRVRAGVPCRQSPVQCAHSVRGAETGDPVLPSALTAQQVYPINQSRPGAGRPVCWAICPLQHRQGGWRAASNGVTSARVMLVLDQHHQLIIALYLHFSSYPHHLSLCLSAHPSLWAWLTGSVSSSSWYIFLFKIRW